MADEMNWRLFDRVLAGDASAEETADVRAWLDASPERQQLFDLLRAQRSAGEPWDVDAAWLLVAGRTIRAETPVGASGTLPFRPRTAPLSGRVRPAPFRAFPWRIAAGFVIVGAALAWWRFGYFSRQPRPATVATAPMRELSVPRGTRASIDLGDGSKALLNGGSRLRYSADIGRGERDVYLDGEAYFTVVHDTIHPFRVHAGAAVAQDVGTKFIMRAYHGVAEAIVVVTEGAVVIRRDGSAVADSAVLTTGMLGLVGPSAGPTTRKVDAARYTAWTQGRLVIDDLSLAEAVPVLERWYDVDIHIGDPPLALRRVSADFGTESLAEALGALSVALDVEVRRDGRRVTFARRGGAR